MSPDPLPDMTEIRRVLLARNDPKNGRPPPQPDTNANNEECGDVPKDNGKDKDNEEPTRRGHIRSRTLEHNSLLTLAV